MKTTSKLWIGIAVLAVLSPLGFILPGYFNAGSAWGEWGAGELRGLVGYIPRGLEAFSSLWNAPMPGYAFRGSGGKGLSHLSFATIISAAAGIVLVVLLVWLIGRVLSRKGDERNVTKS